MSAELCASSVWPVEGLAVPTASLIKSQENPLSGMIYVGFEISVHKPLWTKILKPTYFIHYFLNLYIRSPFIRGSTDVCTHTHTHKISTVFKETLPWHVWTGVCVKMSQNLTVVSPEPLATWQPSGLKLTDITASAWPGKELKVTQNTVSMPSLQHLMQQCPMFLAICQSPCCRLIYGLQWKNPNEDYN